MAGAMNWVASHRRVERPSLAQANTLVHSLSLSLSLFLPHLISILSSYFFSLSFWLFLMIIGLSGKPFSGSSLSISPAILLSLFFPDHPLTDRLDGTFSVSSPPSLSSPFACILSLPYIFNFFILFLFLLHRRCACVRCIQQTCGLIGPLLSSFFFPSGNVHCTGRIISDSGMYIA